MKKVIQMLFILLLFSCKTKKENTESTEFICEILSDTTHLKIITSKNTLISNFDWTPNLLLIDFSEEGKEISDIDYLSELLVEEDTLFITKQFEAKNKIEFDLLKQKGFKIFDLCKYSSEKLSIEEIRNKASEQNVANKLKENKDYFLMIKNPIFNKRRDKVYLRVNTLGSGIEYLFVKEKGCWNKTKVGMWIE